MQAQKLYKLSEQELGQQIVNNGTSQEHKLICAALLMRFKLRTSNFTKALASIAGLKDDKALQDILTSTFNKYKADKGIKLDLQAWDGLMQSNPHWFKRFLEILVLVVTLSFYNAKAKRLENDLDNFLFQAYTSAPQEKIQELTQELIRDISEFDRHQKFDAKMGLSGELTQIKDKQSHKIFIKKSVPNAINNDEELAALNGKSNERILNYRANKYSTIKDPATREVLMSHFMEVMIEKLEDPNLGSAKYILIQNGKKFDIASEKIEGQVEAMDEQDLSTKLRILGLIIGYLDMHKDNVMVEGDKKTAIDFGLTGFNLAKAELDFTKIPQIIQHKNMQIYLMTWSALFRESSETIQDEVQQIQRVFNQNKVEIFRRLGERAEALGIPQNEIKATFEVIQANFELVGKLLQDPMLQHYKLIDQKDNIQCNLCLNRYTEDQIPEKNKEMKHLMEQIENSVSVEKLWTKAQKKVLAEGDHIRSR
jgi:hypothetical protein